jgi:hypothetical protein
MATSAQYQRAARRAARQYNLPFFVRQIRQESGFRDVRSPAGAQGPAQLMPATARSLGVNPHGKRSIWAAARLMRGYVDKYGVEGALRAYNAGPGAIQASHGYAETNAYVRNILRGGNGGTSRGAGGTSGAVGVPGTAGTPGTLVPGVSGAQNQPQGSEGILKLLQALQGQQQAPAGGTLQPPKATAGPAMPQGYQPPQSGGGPAPKVDTNALLESIRTVGGDVQLPAGSPATTIPGTAGTPGSLAAPMSVSGRGGRVVLAPGADRAGVHTHRDVLQFARKVSALTGETLRIGTGTAHSRLTVNGTVSDHWRGEGADIGATGANLVKLGRAALIAAGMSPAQARKQKGGGYNIGGWQIIFNTNAAGFGNHLTHLHIGRRR